MSPESQDHVTVLLERIEAGDDRARRELLEVAYEELRRMAGGMMRRERPNHTLQPTALVNEAVMRLIDANALREAKTRAYFFGVMATAMRQVLVDHARKVRALRRGGGAQRQALDIAIEEMESQHGVDLIALDDALSRLKEMGERQAEIVTLRFFGGLSMAEIAEHLDCSLSTVEKDWKVARAWLKRELDEDG